MSRRFIDAAPEGTVPPVATALWALSGLFLLRVAGQALVEFAGVKFLPAAQEWDSGLIPYPPLLALQVIILIGMAMINTAVTRRRGFFTRPHPTLGRVLLVGSILYAAAMVVRYFVSGSLHPHRRFWPPGSIPIIFHFVLAAYLYTLSRLSRRPIAATSPPPAAAAVQV